MNVYLAALRETDQTGIIQDHASFSKSHKIVSSPLAAELILILGASAREPRQLLDHDIYKSYPSRCVIYTEEDDYLPLLPTVHTNAKIGIHTRIGRVFNYAHISRNGRHRNPFVGETTAAAPIGLTAQKQYLFSFLGGSTSILRKRLFNLNFDRNDILIENTSAYWHWDNSQPDREARQRRYAEALAASHFGLCPRGAGAGSSRFFEVMAAGVVPVLLSDAYALTPGPAWDKFLIRVRERNIARLPAILEPYRASAAERGRLARQAFDEYFAIDCEFDRIVDLASRALQHAPPAEDLFRRRQMAMFRQFERKRKARTALRSLALGALKALHLKNPYQMNR
ncbi:MAG: exostosin family protein [Terracidiphilus sp.]